MEDIVSPFLQMFRLVHYGEYSVKPFELILTILTYYGCPSYSRLENWIQIVWPHDMLLEFTESEMLKDPKILMNSLLGQEMRWLQ